MRGIRKILAAAVIAAFLAGCSGGINQVDIHDYDSYIESGWIKYNLYQYTEACALFAKAKNLDDLRPEAYIGCGWTRLRMQEPLNAVVQFREAFLHITSLADSVDALCGITGAYLAAGENTNVINSIKKYPVSSYEDVFPFRKHDFTISQGDIEIVQAMAFYRLGKYSAAEQANPDNAVYHLNKALYTPVEYTTPQALMGKITDYLSGSALKL